MKSSGKAPVSTSFYVTQGTSDTGRETLLPEPTTAGPWSPDSQHGGPPAALLARAVESLDTGSPRSVGRLTMELLGPVPVGPLSVSASVVRPGRAVELCEATLYDEERGRPVARASAWRFPLTDDGPRQPPPRSGTSPPTASTTTARRAGSAATSTRSTGAGSRAR